MTWFIVRLLLCVIFASLAYQIRGDGIIARSVAGIVWGSLAGSLFVDLHIWAFPDWWEKR